MIVLRVKHEDQYFIANGIDVSSYTQNVEWYKFFRFKFAKFFLSR